ncbi:hypothetical protein GCM10012284_57690 [Mangrovihabitans endophyticus]|uniref:Metallo-peptidase family M12B Reprolysin-like n=1 Tax=Mangrovihabitans endophyticus TaxID=1751298 RepID=A0A8J3FRF1_9ACTN|nr:hypothetical protein GCM10012284_57690 [Mangrovihabitans endophyticus]
MALTVLLTGASATPASAAAPAPSYQDLNPGEAPALTEKVPVNVVFLGYEPSQVSRSGFLSGLARRYEPVVRSRLWYGETEKLGITYTYDYHVTYTDRGYENRFFAQLARLARPAPLTAYQQEYNAQENNVLDVTDNHTIDAPSVEKYLAFHPPAGVDTRRDTVVFVNWYGRPDFRFHVYTKTGEPDPDTGYDFGVQRDSRKLIGWGGTTADDEETGLGATRRVWFLDLSAGPESNMNNYDVDHPDVDGDGEPDYRMPAAWEYTPGGYRAPAALTSDLALLTRYVAVNLLMTTSPLYPVELPADLPTSINIDSNTYEGWPGVDASAAYIKPDLVVSELSELRWRNRLDFDNQDLPFDQRARECFLGEFETYEPCYPDLDYPSDANLYLYNRENLARTQDDDGRVDYELPVFNYATPDYDTPLGYADDDWTTGTQSYVFAFVSPGIVEAGYGLSATQIHEVGHHLGLSHPHDGYDSASGQDYEPTGDRFFAWAGDESNTMMSYIDLNWDFSQFDRDNSDRWMTAAYYAAANTLATDVARAPRASRAAADLRGADVLLGLARQAFAAHRYRTAYALSEQAYDRVVAGARHAGADPASAARTMAARADRARRESAQVHSPHEFIDTLAPDGKRSRP